MPVEFYIEKYFPLLPWRRVCQAAVPVVNSTDMAVDGTPVEKWVRHLELKKPTAVADSPFAVMEILSGTDDRRASGERGFFSEIQTNASVFNCVLLVFVFSTTSV